MVGRPTAARPREGSREGLRERRRRLLRQELSDAATQLFMERGFDTVRVAEVAEACGVSETTVFNHFPTKEALFLDRLETTMAALRSALADNGIEPIQATMRVLETDLSAITEAMNAQEDPTEATAAVVRFAELIRVTPSLQAYKADIAERCVTMATEILADRACMRPEDPEPQVAARALVGLWHIQVQSLRRHLDGGATPTQLHAAVMSDVRRAAELVEAGMGTFLVR
jgi:AcrR family transcriptional regulator